MEDTKQYIIIMVQPPHVIMFAMYVAGKVFVVAPLLYLVLNVLLVQETIKAFEFELIAWFSNNHKDTPQLVCHM